MTADHSGRVDLAEKFARFREHWQPKIAAEFNGQSIKLAKVQGEFVWHHHADADEVFYVFRGRMRLHLRDRVVELMEGQLFVVPRGVEHKPEADQEAWIVLLEPAETRNTGEVVSERTATVERI